MTDLNLQTVEEAKEAVAAQIGVSADSVRTVEADWLKFMQEGVIVDVHIRYWRMKARLTLEDLGLETTSAEEAKVLEDVMSVGEKYLFPVEFIKAINSADSGLRQTVRKHGFKTAFGQFIPATAFDAFLSDFKRFEEKIYAIRDQIDSNWTESVAKVQDAYAVAARVAYRRLMKLSAKSWSYGAEDSFVDSFMTRIMSAIPARSDVYNRFSVELEMRYIPLPSLLEADAQKAELIKEEAAAQREESEAVKRMRAEVSLRAQQSKYEMIEEFRTTVIGQLQNTAYDAALDVLETLKRNDGALIGPSVKQLRNMVQTLQNLNFFADSDVDSMIATIGKQLDFAETSARDAGQVQKTMRDIATVTRSKILSLGQSAARSGREVGIIDAPDAFTVRAARQNLGLTVDADSTSNKRSKRSL